MSNIGLRRIQCYENLRFENFKIESLFETTVSKERQAAVERCPTCRIAITQFLVNEAITVVVYSVRNGS